MTDERPALFPGDDGLKPWQRNEMATEAARRREEAVAQVEAHALPDVRALLLRAVRAVAEAQPMLTSEDVILAYKGSTPHEPRMLGAVMREAKRQGWITPTEEWRLSIRPESHRRPQRVWRSLIFGVVS